MNTPPSSQVLARKWRPRTFDDMVGQETIVQALRHALRSGRLHQAYLLTGTRGVGKTTLARLMARGLNCEQGPTDVPCGHCPACIGIEQGRFPDLLEVDAATNTRVEEMRELLENTQYLPVAGRFKVYLIDEVHMLSRSAFNAMLKTLEEPPPHVKFILATTDPQKVPVTVLSRCLQFSLRPLPPAQIADRLRHVLEQEQLPFEASALPLLAAAAQGSLRDALSLLDQALAFGAGEVRQDPVRAMLGTLERSALLDLVRALAEGDGETLIACADTLAEHSLSFDHALQELAVLFHDLALLQAIPNAPALQDSARELGAWQARWPAATLQLLYQITVQARRDLPFAPDERAGFRMALLRLLAFQPGPPAPLPAPPPPSAPPVPNPAPAPAPAPAPPQRAHLPPAIDDWAGLVERLQLMGMTHELARHVEWLGMTQHQIRLRLAHKFAHLLPYQEKLRTGLESVLDCDLNLSIELGEEEGTSVAQQEAQTQAQAHQQALQTLARDPFVQAVRDELGGALVESSVKPLPQGEKS
ncbi:DNA polymerase III subunit gamma/tau [Ferrovum sp.]|uniref:DNA polymerase III subunit gamma/tau n=1 Tax=Ferrovum sp. TaxID=2609467 RepID=UPI0026214DD2|nr:DNA polymerase III subunit gamma/tau [Ferrovum sp.]